MTQTPERPVIYGPVDGNIFSVVGAAREAMRRAGESRELLTELSNRIMQAGSYNEALVIVGEYVDFDFGGDDDTGTCDRCGAEAIYAECADCGLPLCDACADANDGYCGVCS